MREHLPIQLDMTMVRPRLTGSFLDAWSDVIHAIFLLQLVDQYGDADELRNRMVGLLREAESRAGDHAPIEKVHTVRLALVAFADETIVSSGWSGSQSWARRSLQSELLDINDAGDRFFEVLDELMLDARGHQDELKVYQLCLLAGFKGKFVHAELPPSLTDRIREAIAEEEERSTEFLLAANPRPSKRSGRTLALFVMLATALVILTGQWWLSESVKDASAAHPTTRTVAEK